MEADSGVANVGKPAQPIQPMKGDTGYAGEFIGERFENKGVIGTGSYGDVYKVRHRETGKYYAIKKYKKIFTSRILALRTLRELVILRKINNNRIIKIYDILPPLDIENYDSLGVVI